MTLKKIPDFGIYFDAKEISSSHASEIASFLNIGFFSEDDLELLYNISENSYYFNSNEYFVVASKSSMQMIVTKTPMFSDGPMRKLGCQKVDNWFE